MAAARDLPAAFAHVATLLREGDPDRFFATLFAPADKRPHLHALYAFSLEIARIRDSVSEALPGEIRLQWWRDALQGEARGDVMANPVAAALDDTVVRCRLPRQALVNLIDARVGDLYDDPIPTLNDLEGYCGETSSTLIRLASLVLAAGGDPGSPDAAGHAGVAYAVAGLLRAFPYDVRRGRVALPQSVLDQHGVTRDDLLAGRRSPALDRALGEMRGVAHRHLDIARRSRGTLPAPVKPAFLPVALVDGYLRRMERGDYDPFRTVVDRPLWLKQGVLWRAARAGRF